MIFSKIAIPLTGACLAFAGVSAVENLLPVTIGMQADFVSKRGGVYTVRVSGYKIKECIPMSETFAGWYRKDGVWVEDSGFNFPSDSSPGDAKPKSYSRTDFGLFQWTDIEPGADKVRVTVIQDCGDGNLEISTVGPWDVEGEK